MWPLSLFQSDMPPVSWRSPGLNMSQVLAGVRDPDQFVLLRELFHSKPEPAGVFKVAAVLLRVYQPRI